MDIGWIHHINVPKEIEPVLSFVPLSVIIEIITGCPEDMDYQEILWCYMESAIPRVVIDSIDFQMVDFFVESLVVLFYNHLMVYSQTFLKDDAFYVFHSWLDVNSICLKKVR